MTVSRHKRRMSTTRAVALSLGGVGVAALFGIVGGVAIYNTEDGQVQGSDVPVDRFPETPTGMIAVIDDAGNLGSLVVFAVRPDGEGDGYDPHGGSLVPIPVTADSSGGFGDERTPLNETVAMYGAATLTDEVSALLGVSLDGSTVVDADTMTAILSPLGPVSVDLPVAVVGADGSEVAPAGRQTLDSARVAAVLAASDPSDPLGEQYGVDVAVWRAIGTAVGDGLDAPLEEPPLSGAPAEPGATDASGVPVTFDIGTLLGDLSSGPFGVASLHPDALTDLGVNPRGVDVVALDRAEVVTLFAHVAPSRMAAPNPGYNFLVRSSFPDDQLVDGPTRYDTAYAATAALIGDTVQGNVLSVQTSPADERGAATVIEVSDASMIPAAEALADVFGTVDVRIAQRRVAGINMIVELGTDYLTVVAAESSPIDPTAASGSSPPVSAESSAPVASEETAPSD